MEIKKRMKKISLVLSIIFMVAIITSCGNTGKFSTETPVTAQATTIKSAFPIIIKDSYDREVKIEKEPQRIVSLAPNITETVFALERGDRLVGRTEYCDYPAEAAKIESVGTLKTPSIEKIASLKPDLVIASTHFNKDILKKLEELNITTVVLYGEENFDGVYETITKIGSILDSEEKALAVIGEMKKKVDMVAKKVQGKDKPSVYYVVGYGKQGDYTPGGNTFISQLIAMAGGKNAADDIEGWKYSLEKLIEKNPELMVCPSDGGFKQGLETTNGYKDLDAVKNGKLYEFDANLVNRQGPRLADGLVELAKIIHPEAMK